MDVTFAICSDSTIFQKSSFDQPGGEAGWMSRWTGRADWHYNRDRLITRGG